MQALKKILSLRFTDWKPSVGLSWFRKEKGCDGPRKKEETGIDHSFGKLHCFCLNLIRAFCHTNIFRQKSTYFVNTVVKRIISATRTEQKYFHFLKIITKTSSGFLFCVHFRLGLLQLITLYVSAFSFLHPSFSLRVWERSEAQTHTSSLPRSYFT